MVFQLSPDANTDMTSLRGYVVASYPELEELFGDPLESDGYKISGEWIFEDGDGNVFTLYDWKSTELYDSGLESVRQFRNNKSKTEFHIGGRGSAIEFINWIEYKLSKLRLDDAVADEFNEHVRSGLGS